MMGDPELYDDTSHYLP